MLGSTRWLATASPLQDGTATTWPGEPQQVLPNLAQAPHVPSAVALPELANLPPGLDGRAESQAAPIASQLRESQHVPLVLPEALPVVAAPPLQDGSATAGLPEPQHVLPNLAQTPHEPSAVAWPEQANLPPGFDGRAVSQATPIASQLGASQHVRLDLPEGLPVVAAPPLQVGSATAWLGEPLAPVWSGSQFCKQVLPQQCRLLVEAGVPFAKGKIGEKRSISPTNSTTTCRCQTVPSRIPA